MHKPITAARGTFIAGKFDSAPRRHQVHRVNLLRRRGALDQTLQPYVRGKLEPFIHRHRVRYEPVHVRVVKQHRLVTVEACHVDSRRRPPPLDLREGWRKKKQIAKPARPDE